MEKLPKTLPGTGLSDLPPRRNISSAISAYWHSKTFFDTMRGLGLAPESYMATAEGPLAVHYRSGIVPGPGRDGRTINAQVRYEVAPDATLQSKPSIDMHLALANLNRWARVKAGTPGSQLEPLGMASCGRWMMHEFGHYLLAARIGQLEFDFAHSSGELAGGGVLRSAVGSVQPDLSRRPEDAGVDVSLCLRAAAARPDAWPWAGAGMGC
ncbi:hypothetical protein ACM258_10620 [Phaeobacter piscinae]|uniref:hypothetical protein n=1 Tax=Phaeobacter piscinae TaxID=1580596 RepID=UPI0039F67584